MTVKFEWLFLIAVVFNLLGCNENISEIPQYGLHEIEFYTTNSLDQFPLVVFTRPDGSKVNVDGFPDGGKQHKARAYCNQKGTWEWEVANVQDYKPTHGKFNVIASSMKGKLKKHPRDPYQFAYDNGDWFLHIGDTGYRYLTDTEPYWKEYIDQAVKMGATKIRTWFCSSRHNVEALFDQSRNRLNHKYWQEMDRRIAYAYENHPNVILQLIPFGEDTEELKRYAAGDQKSFKLARYAQARFSAYPNIMWCISNDREIVDKNTKLRGRQIHSQTINEIAQDMAEREPWGTLITNHQSRFSGYSFIDAPWSGIVTVEDLDQVDGRMITFYRENSSCPIVNDEDRYEKYREPKYPQYYFRRLMWASLLSGGHATYGGIKNYEPYSNDSLRGVQGYFDVALQGANDFQYIHKFFTESGLTLVNMIPDDKITGNDPQRFKCIHNNSDYIIYLANPDKTGQPETKGNKSTEISSANESSTIPGVTINLPNNQFFVKWFDPSTGIWSESRELSGGLTEINAHGPGDWILLLTKI